MGTLNHVYRCKVADDALVSERSYCMASAGATIVNNFTIDGNDIGLSW